MEKTKAAFRAVREACGLSQQDVADEADVKVLSVKKWESAGSDIKQPPDDVWQWLLQARAALMEDAREQADGMAESTDSGPVTLWYYRTQEQLDAVQLDEGVDEPVGYCNVRTREVMRLLDQAEVRYRIEYR